MRGTQRGFVGLPVPEDWRDPLGRVQDALGLARPVPEDDLHLTLAFLGERPPAEIDGLAEALAMRPMRRAPLRSVGILPFGGAHGAAVAVEVAPDLALVALHDTVRSAAREAGLDLPRRRFRPHVTLARLRGSAARARLPETLRAVGLPPLPAAEADAVVLWSSTLTPAGPIYAELARWPLIAAAV